MAQEIHILDSTQLTRVIHTQNHTNTGAIRDKFIHGHGSRDTHFRQHAINARDPHPKPHKHRCCSRRIYSRARLKRYASRTSTKTAASLLMTGVQTCSSRYCTHTHAHTYTHTHTHTHTQTHTHTNAHARTHTHTQTHTHAHTHIHTRAHTHENVLSTKETRKAMQWTKLELVRAVNALFVTVCLVISCLRMLCQEPLVVFGLQCSRLTMQVLILV